MSHTQTAQPLDLAKRIFVAVLTLLACAPTPEADPQATTDQALCRQVSNTPILPSLVVTDPRVLSRFSFQRTMDQLLTSVASTQARQDVWASWMKTFAKGSGGCDSNGIDPNGYGLTCPRSNEAALASADPFNASSAFQLVPLALFNRFDLTPGDASTCGEYRIVYGMPHATPSRALIIFEAALPNPTPSKGLDGCLPIARFWQSLPTLPGRLGDKLEAFYYLGTAIPGVPAVVDAAHYGLGNPGQIRTNTFVAAPAGGPPGIQQWNLREFKTALTLTTLSLAQVTVKNNPANELFEGTHAQSADFQTAFLANVPRLAFSDAGIPGIAMQTNDPHNEFESISQAPVNDVVYRLHAQTSFRSAIQASLASLGSPLTVDQLLNRATTQTCAGCHALSGSNGDLGQGLTFPSSQTNRFVHVSELVADDGSGQSLSQVLTGIFLPARRDALEAFINARCTGSPTTVPDGMTVGGGATGAAN